MRLYSLRIQNFRSIIDTGEVKISESDNITILAGQNESGKTSVLEALEFFQNGAGPDFNEEQRKLGTFPKVSCLFHLNDEELDRIEESTNKKVREYFKANGVTWYRGDTEKDDFDKLNFLADEALDTLLSNISSSEILNSQLPPSKTEEAEEQKVAEPPPIARSPHELETMLNTFRPEIIMYSSFEDSLLPAKVKYSDIDVNQAVKDFEKVFLIDFKALLIDTVDRSRQQKLETLNSQASEDLNEYWTQKIGDEDTKYKYKVEAYPQETQTNSYVVFSIDRGNNEPLSLRQKSTGFRWFASFVLRLRAHEASSSEPGKFILLIDEPGQGLHEEAQKNVMRVLNELGQKGWQTIYSTHLPQLLGGQDVDISRIKLVIISKNKGTKVKNIAQSTTDKGFKDALSPLRTAIGQVSLDVNSFLVGKKTVIVEGITDFYFLRAFVQLGGLLENYSFIPSTGVSQLCNIFAILYGWGLTPFAILDDDGAGRKEYSRLKKAYFQGSDEETKKYIFINSGCAGIEDVFKAEDFKKLANGLIIDSILDDDIPNSKKAKGNKELIGRTFWDKVKSGEIELKDLLDETKKNIEKINRFLKRKV